MTTNETSPLGSVCNAELGAWNPMETAPASGLIWLAVEAADGERRTFAAEASHENGEWVWAITTGWATGWKNLPSGWRPILWMPHPQAPNLEFTGFGRAQENR